MSALMPNIWLNTTKISRVARRMSTPTAPAKPQLSNCSTCSIMICAIMTSLPDPSKDGVMNVPRLEMKISNRADTTPGNDSGKYIRSEEHTSELQSLMRISYAVFCLQKKKLIHEQ